MEQGAMLPNVSNAAIADWAMQVPNEEYSAVYQTYNTHLVSFAALTPDQLIRERKSDVLFAEYNRIRQLFFGALPTNAALRHIASTVITVGMIWDLKTENTVNSDFIDSYLSMLNDRESKLHKQLDCKKTSRKPRNRNYFYSTMLLSQLTASTYNYENLLILEEQPDLNDCDRLFIPMNVNQGHWVMVVVDLERKTIKCYDSHYRDRNDALKVVKDWLVDGFKHGKLAVDPSNWKPEMEATQNVPQQGNNAYDCGIFAVLFADFLCDDLPLLFTLEDIPHFRRKMGCDILRGYINH